MWRFVLFLSGWHTSGQLWCGCCVEFIRVDAENKSGRLFGRYHADVSYTRKHMSVATYVYSNYYRISSGISTRHFVHCLPHWEPLDCKYVVLNEHRIQPERTDCSHSFIHVLAYGCFWGCRWGVALRRLYDERRPSSWRTSLRAHHQSMCKYKWITLLLKSSCFHYFSYPLVSISVFIKWTFMRKCRYLWGRKRQPWTSHEVAWNVC